MRRSRSLQVVACALLGFVAVLALRPRHVNPDVRLPRRHELAALIGYQKQAAITLRREIDDLRRRVADIQASSVRLEAGQHSLEDDLAGAKSSAGLTGVRGPGVRVTLDDAERTSASVGDVNDLVIHSQDVQAVVNALWQAGAEAIGINGQRLVGTSAVLCVGNTLLLNGTVHSPPYQVSAIGAVRDRFEGDRLVHRLHDAASTFGLRFSVSKEDALDVPAFRGTTAQRFAHAA